MVEVYVGYLRRKLGENLITTVRGMGCRYDGGEGGASASDEPPSA
jgi:DNA-binding response OmpR family regulator